MAAANRSERQLMRQRGAGTRDNGNAAFGLEFGLRDARQERQLMRQRGAGNRKVDKIDFGFCFPTPSRPRRSVSKTPQTASRTTIRSSEPPPQRSSREPSTVRSVRYSSVDHAPPATQTRRSLRNRQSLINIEELAQITKEPPSEDGGITAAQILRTGMSPFANTPNRMFTITENVPDIEDEPPQLPDEPLEETTPVQNSPLFVPQNDDKENEESHTAVKQMQQKRKKRKSIIQHIGGRKKRRTSAGPAVQPITTESERVDPLPSDVDHEVDDGDAHDEELELPQRPRETSTQPDDGGSQVEEVSQKKQRRRSSRLPGSAQKRASDVPRDQLDDRNQTDEQSTTGTFAGVYLPDLDLDSNLPEPVKKKSTSKWIPGHSMARQRIAARKRGSRMSVSTSPEPHAATDREGDETYVEEVQSPEPPTPAPRRKPRSRAKRDSNASEESSDRRSRRTKGSTFPILTYRMTNVSALPTITEEGEDDQELNAADDQPGPFTDRAAPNGVDVLAQICRETIETAIANHEAAVDSNKNRADIKRKRIALERFSKDIDQRLFDMSEAVEKRLNLEARLRKMKREKAELEARWLSIRQQRETLALTADDIRRQNWENDERSKRQQDISELAYRTELEMERGEPADVNLEFLLQTVAGSASITSSEGGILNKVKAFNARLERLVSSIGG